MNRTHLTGLMWLTLALMLALCLQLTHGQFFYTLDDPYIHLTLAQHLFAGEYALNAGTFAAPSSSVLWPFLLVPFMAFSWAAWVPLVINSLCMIATGLVIFRVLARTGLKTAGLATYTLLLATNAFGLVFTGMEHSLQVLLATMIVAGLIDVSEQRTPRGLMVALMVAPLIRYEMVGFSVLAIGLLAVYGHYRYVWVGVIFSAILAGFSLFLWHHSGEFLPASIMGKMRFYHSPLGNQLMLALIIACGLTMAWLFRTYHATRNLVLWSCAIVALQLFFGKNGWFNRYEVYVLASAGFILVYACMQHRKALLEQKAVLIPLVFTAILSCCWYGMTTFHTPSASRCIRLQHGEMQRLIDVAGKPPVAVNDIGLVGFRNPASVFDLFGLGDWQANRLLRTDPRRLLEQVRARNIPLVMIYPDWFPHVPEQWVKLGTLRQQNAQENGCAVAGEEVVVYASDRSYVGSLNRAITTWQRDLPQGASWVSIVPK